MLTTSCPGCSRPVMYKADELPLNVECIVCDRRFTIEPEPEPDPAPEPKPALGLAAGGCAALLAVIVLGSVAMSGKPTPPDNGDTVVAPIRHRPQAARPQPPPDAAEPPAAPREPPRKKKVGIPPGVYSLEEYRRAVQRAALEDD